MCVVISMQRLSSQQAERRELYQEDSLHHITFIL